MPLVFGGLWLVAWLDSYAHVGTLTLWLLAALMLLAALVDHVAALLGVKRVGAAAGVSFIVALALNGHRVRHAGGVRAGMVGVRQHA